MTPLVQGHEEPESDQQAAEDATDGRGHAGRPGEASFTCQRNERRIRPPSSGKAGRRLKTSRTRLMYPSQAAAPSTEGSQRQPPRDEHEEHADHERDERPGDRDPELSACGGKVAAELRHAAEQPQRDPLDLHAFPPRLERVAELVGRSSDRKKSNDAAIAITRYVLLERPGFWLGNTFSESDHVISPKTTSQLQLMPIRMPAIRPSEMLSPIRGRVEQR